MSELLNYLHVFPLKVLTELSMVKVSNPADPGGMAFERKRTEEVLRKRNGFHSVPRSREAW